MRSQHKIVDGKNKSFDGKLHRGKWFPVRKKQLDDVSW